MKYNQPFGISDPNAPYINGNPSTGTMGSIPPAAAIEFPQREIVNVILMSGLAPDNASTTQMASGIQSQWMNFGVDAGTVNNLQANLSAIPILRDGLVARIKVAQSNTGPSVLNLNAEGAVPVRRKGNAELLANDLQAGSIATMTYNATWAVWELVGVGGSGARGELIANKNLYVNYTIGNDSNDGIANDAQHAVRNIQRAIDIAFSYAPSQYVIVINVADSPNYAGFSTPNYPGPPIAIIGNIAAPQNVAMYSGNQHCCLVQGINNVTIQGVMPSTAPSGTSGPAGCFVAVGNSVLNVNQCASGACHGAVFEAYGGAQVNIDVKHVFDGNSGELFWAIGSGTVGLGVYCVFTVNRPLTVDTTARTDIGGLIGISPQLPTFINPSYVTGYRYSAQLGGIISVLGQGPNYFPGTIAGSVVNGGLYA